MYHREGKKHSIARIMCIIRITQIESGGRCFTSYTFHFLSQQDRALNECNRKLWCKFISGILIVNDNKFSLVIIKCQFHTVTSLPNRKKTPKRQSKLLESIARSIWVSSVYRCVTLRLEIN